MRKVLVKRIKKAKKELKKYDKFFTSLKRNKIIYQNLTFYEDSPVNVVSWNKKTGMVLGRYTLGNITKEEEIIYYKLHLKPHKPIIYV